MDGVTWYHTYNSDGLRTVRTSNSKHYSYVYNGDKLTYMTAGDKHMYFAYDANGTPMSIVYSGTVYYYVTNVQGDVIALVDSTGAEVVSYSYDAWGKPLETTGTLKDTLGVDNPLRYRSYVYDTETDLYYLQGRYYNPEIGRFINADDVDCLGANGDFASLNLFAYCGNNPISRADSNGEAWHVLIGAVLGGAFEIGAQLISNGGNFSDINWTKVGIATVVGGVTALCGPASGAIVSGVGNVAMELADGTTDVAKLGVSFAVGAGASVVGYGLGKAVQKIGGKIAVNSLSKKAPGQIKRVVNKVIDVAGRDRNRIKDLTWTLSQKAYSHLPDVLIGKSIPQIFNSIGVGVSGYGTMGAIYGFK